MKWRPGGRSRLGRMQNPDEPTETSDEAAVKAQWCSKHWGQVWSPRRVDSNVLSRLLSDLDCADVPRFRPEAVHFPDAETIECAIKHAGSAATGPDGIPFAAYRAYKERSALVLADYLRLFNMDDCTPNEMDGAPFEEFLVAASFSIRCCYYQIHGHSPRQTRRAQ